VKSINEVGIKEVLLGEDDPVSLVGYLAKAYGFVEEFYRLGGLFTRVAVADLSIGLEIQYCAEYRAA